MDSYYPPGALSELQRREAEADRYQHDLETATECAVERITTAVKIESNYPYRARKETRGVEDCIQLGAFAHLIAMTVKNESPETIAIVLHGYVKAAIQMSAELDAEKEVSR